MIVLVKHYFHLFTCQIVIGQWPVVRSMVSANHWLSSIKTNRLSWYLTLVSANQASSNSAQFVIGQFDKIITFKVVFQINQHVMYFNAKFLFL